MGIFLRECPFCGTSNDTAERIWLIPDDGIWWKVYAGCCDFTGPYKATKAEAANAWNTRAGDTNDTTTKS